jgi:hypothetical protein
MTTFLVDLILKSSPGQNDQVLLQATGNRSAGNNIFFIAEGGIRKGVGDRKQHKFSTRFIRATNAGAAVSSDCFTLRRAYCTVHMLKPIQLGRGYMIVQRPNS